MSKKILQKESGFTLTEILIATAVLAIIFFITAKFFKDFTMVNRKHSTSHAIRDVRDSLAYTLYAKSAWDQTVRHAVNNGSGFNCIRGASDCSGVPQAGFTPVDSSGNLLRFKDRSGADRVYDPENNPAHGFDLDGKFCDTFSLANTDATCPFRFEFSWQPECRAAATVCLMPNTRINISFSTSLSAGEGWLPLNVASFNKTIFHEGQNVLVAPYDCPRFYALVGFDQGAPQCRRWNSI